MCEVLKEPDDRHYLKDCQYLMKEYDFKKNQSVNLDNITLGSHLKIFWICAMCGNSWLASVQNRSKGRGCPTCAQKQRIITRNNNRFKQVKPLAETDECLLKEWNYKRNEKIGLTPYNVTRGSNKKAWWKCSKNHEYEMQICNKTNGRGCPICSNKVIKAGYNDLATTNPELLKEWDYKKNNKLGIKTNEVSRGSSKKAWWKCDKNHHYEMQIVRKTARGYGCPICSNNMILVGYNDLATTDSDILKEWNYEKNNELGVTPQNVTRGSNKKVWWVCHKNHSYSSTICHHVIDKRGCPICTKQLQTSFPEQAVYFYVKQLFPKAINSYKPEWIGKSEIDIFIPALNLGIEYDGLLYHKGKEKEDNKKKQLLNQHGIELIRVKETKDKSVKNTANTFYYLIDNRYKNLNRTIVSLLEILSKKTRSTKAINVNIDSDRLKIEEQYLKFEKANSLAIKYPDIAAEWDYEKNGKVRPEFVSCHSASKYWFICPKGHESYYTAVDSRTSHSSGCPRCSGRIAIQGETDLATTNPELLKEWDYEENVKNGITPQNITAHSNKIVHWICFKKHKWTSRPSDRTKGNNCPICSNQKILGGYNDLATTDPEILVEWDYEENDQLGIKPNEVGRGSSKKVWWICKNKEEYKHKYISTIHHHVVRKQSCPYCSGTAVLKGYNDLATTNPELLKEWDYKKNDSLKVYPNNVSKGSNIKVHWVCSICKHKWVASINNRTKNHGCPNFRRHNKK